MAKVAAAIEDRLLAQSLPEPNSGCWLWIGTINANGYAAMTIGSRTDGTRKTGVTVSRLAYEITHGEIPSGLHVLHRCDNAACVNPDHLYAGTRSQNMQDAWDRGRQPRNSERWRHRNG